jgi:hypothetical protein
VLSAGATLTQVSVEGCFNPNPFPSSSTNVNGLDGSPGESDSDFTVLAATTNLRHPILTAANQDEFHAVSGGYPFLLLEVEKWVPVDFVKESILDAALLPHQLPCHSDFGRDSARHRSGR